MSSTDNKIGKLLITDPEFKQKTRLLEKHFHDRTLQPLSEFNKAGEKETGCSSGFRAEHQYGEGDKVTFMIKSVLNHTLTEEEKRSKLKQFKESFYKASERDLKLSSGLLYKLKSVREFAINTQWQQVESDICYDDLNIADFIREYIAGDLYKLFLYDRAPVIELVTNNNLPKKRFVKDKAQSSENHKKYEKGKHKFQDQFKEHIEQEKNQDQLYLRSKFLDKFTTLMDLKEKGENYQDAEGFEKILAAQMLLGEADIVHPENFGVIEKEYENAKGKKVKEKLWAKIDHGRSFYLSFSNAKDYLQNFLIFLTQLRNCGIKIDLGNLSKELIPTFVIGKTNGYVINLLNFPIIGKKSSFSFVLLPMKLGISSFIDCYDQNKEKFEVLIDRKASSLNHILNSGMEFTLGYIDGSKLHRRNFKHMNGKFKGQEVHFCFLPAFDNSSGTSFSDYFKQRLETQVEMARNLVGALKNLDKVEKIYSYMIKPSFCLFVPTLITAIFTSGTLGTAFTATAAITGTCMLVGIVTAICLSVYVRNSCNSKIDSLNAEQFQAPVRTA